MTQSTAKPKNFTFEEYLAYDDGTDNKYELVDGELVLMPQPTYKHENIIFLLLVSLHQEIQRLGLDWVVRNTNVGVRTASKKSRNPDLCVIEGTLWRQNPPNVSAVLEEPPLLVVEVVSESTVATDYRYKRSEYAALEIPEYWIVDSLTAKVSVLLLVEGFYEVTEIMGCDKIVSPTFPELELTVQQVLEA